MSGRPAALPSNGYQPRPRLLGEEELSVRFAPEDRGEPEIVFDLSDWPISLELRTAFARSFHEKVRPGGGRRTGHSARRVFGLLRAFARFLGTLKDPPQTVGQLAALHVKKWAFAGGNRPTRVTDLRELKAMLRKVPGISDAFTSYLLEPAGKATPTKITGYSRSEYQRIMNAARAGARRAADRIRGNRELLEQWRAGELGAASAGLQKRASLLDFVDQHTDVPRYQPARGRRGLPRDWTRKFGSSTQLLQALHLSPDDAVAFMVLLIGLTGHNHGTLLKTPAAHHRPDGHAGGTATAIVELDKRRRGPGRHMDVPLTDVPAWAFASEGPAAGSPSADLDKRDDLRTPFGIYMLLLELTERSRAVADSRNLFIWWSESGFRTQMADHHTKGWAHGQDLPSDQADDAKIHQPQPQIQLSLRRLRLTFAELHQKPVAHTETTLANEYLVRNRGNLAEYQKVVAAALDQEVIKAKTRGRLRRLSPEEILEARDHPARVAARHDMDTGTLTRMLAGELDTVMAACVDNTNSPHTPAGQPCRASFMLCLSCRCARATPQHLPLQVLVHDALEARRTAMTPLRWTQRFALSHAQLADLLQQAGPVAIADARAAATAEQHRLVERFLRRELDVS